MDIASASKQLKHQQERCKSLEVTVEKLQSQLNESHISHLGAMKMLEADLLLARQTVRKKGLSGTCMRKYLTLKAEFDDSTGSQHSPARKSNSTPPQTASSSSATNQASAPRSLPSREAYCLVKLKSDSKKIDIIKVCGKFFSFVKCTSTCIVARLN